MESDHRFRSKVITPRRNVESTGKSNPYERPQAPRGRGYERTRNPLARLQADSRASWAIRIRVETAYRTLKSARESGCPREYPMKSVPYVCSRSATERGFGPKKGI